MRTLKTLIWMAIIVFLWTYFYSKLPSYPQEKIIKEITQPQKPKIVIEKITTTSDKDNDGINDIDDIVEWARLEVKNKTTYQSNYYSWWYPPETEWVCTDVVRRALKNAWIDLKKLMDQDIKNNISAYPRVEWKPDPNIDFRRVPNLDTYLKRNATSLTTEIIPWDRENLKQWQPWDIVTFDKPYQHTAIISDKRDEDWVPYMIHNPAPYPQEDTRLLPWTQQLSDIMGHYRWKY